MATTPNYGWVTPAPTDFVTDLPADFETFADAADATVKALNPGTTAGDLDYYTSGTAKSRLAIGTAGQVLTVNAGATAPEWATVGGSAANFTLLNAGGTSLTGSATITVSGISNKEKLFILIVNASSANASSVIRLRFNADTATNYEYAGNNALIASAYAAGNFGQLYDSTDRIDLGIMSGTNTSVVSAGLFLSGASGVDIKPFSYNGGGSASGNNGQYIYNGHGIYKGTSAISSVSVISSTGNFDNGTIFVYGSDN